jgi:hypothetical protein
MSRSTLSGPLQTATWKGSGWQVPGLLQRAYMTPPNGLDHVQSVEVSYVCDLFLCYLPFYAAVLRFAKRCPTWTMTMWMQPWMTQL